MSIQSIHSAEGHRIDAEEKEGFLFITLHLKGNKYGRNIGRVRLKDRVLEIHREIGKHLMIKNQSYGFNEYVIRHGKTFDKIQLTDDNGVYLFPREMVLNMGQYLYFKEVGFEKQLFLKTAIIYNHKIKSI